MERLGKKLPACLNRICYARTSKHGLSYCKWKGYVNCLSEEFRQTRCSCIATKQLSRGYRSVSNDIQTSSHILMFKPHNDKEWILLLPKQGGYEQRREYSSSSEGDNKDKTDQKEEKDENKKKREAMYFVLGHMFAVQALFMAIFTMDIHRRRNIPQHIRWEEFEQEYLMKGRVQQIDVHPSYSGRPEDVAVVTLHTLTSPDLFRGSKLPESKIIVVTGKGEFVQKLDHFERVMKVPHYERIQARAHARAFWPEDQAQYNTTVGQTALLSLVLAVMAGINYRRSRAHSKSKFDQYSKLYKQFSEKERNLEETLKKHEAARREKLNQLKNEQEKLSKKRDASKISEEEKKKETFADMVRESIFQDRGFKIKRGDIIMKDEISMRDVAGLHEPKVEILEFIDYVKNPERFQTLGAKTPRGALLTGPPGCGKTLLAKALAAECGVPFYFIAASELDDMIVGVGAQRVRALFKKAREQSPCIIYIDELDAIGMRRAATDRGQSNSDREMTLNQLLAEMDGMYSREGVIILASTNRADMLDKALLRPGRFDRHISIDLPTFKERIEHFDVYLSKLTLNNPISTYSTKLAQLTPGMSGADIAYICNEAAIHAARNNNKKVTAKDFEYAVERKIAGAAKATNTVGVFEKKVIAYHESGHALVGWLLEHTDALLKVTIIPRTSGVGGFAQYLPQENKLYSKEHLFDIMCMALGGRVAETVIFDHLSTGAQDDLRKVTGIAYAQIRSYGMGENFGLLSFPEDQGGLRPFSKQLSSMLDLEARQLVARAHRHTEQLLKNNKDKLHKIAALLLERETISAQDVEDMIGPPPFGEKQMIDPLHFYEDELRSAKQTTTKKENA